MAGALLSNWWYRVANRRPKLRAHARLYRHRYRGEVWYLLQDPGSARVHRFSPSARLIISLMDGSRTVAELWEIANRHLGADAPTQDEMIELLGQLHAADLLQSDVSPDVAEAFSRGEREERARHLRSYANPMAIRIPFWDPNRFLDRFTGLWRFIWGRWGILLWIVTVLPALVLLWPHWTDLTSNFGERVLALENLLVLYLVFPILKALHEMGHASATKAGGGEVHDVGVILLVLLPVPYVDASASTVFKSKYQRALVGMAGVAAELFVAAIAFYLWLLIEPGFLRAVLFNVMLIAGISTLLFNGNPLLRYDAYYVLADLIEIPNLAQRSTRYWRYLIERYVLGARDQGPDTAPGEKGWFLFYAFASTIYRILITITIALFIAGQFFFVGVLLAIWAVIAMAVFPVVKSLRHLFSDQRLRRRRRRAVVVASLAAAAVGACLFVLPAPFHSYAEGVLWLPEGSMVRAGANGFLAEFTVSPGAPVKQGDRLGRLQDPVLQAQLRRAEARVAELKAEYDIQFVADRTKAQIARDKLEAEEAILARVRERSGEMAIRAGADGVFVVPEVVDMPGRYYRKGELLGYVIGSDPPLVRAVVDQQGVDQVRRATDTVRVRVADRPQIAFEGRILREVPTGLEYLPHAALSIEGGGEIATDPRDTKGPKAMQRMFQFDIAVPDIGAVGQFGQRAFVRFEHPMEPLAAQWYRSIRLLFLSRFNV